MRLLTIHAAKGLEFKVVVVADAGRSRPPVSDILALSDGRFGFKVAHPATGTRVVTESYKDVKEHRDRAEQAERLRLYYVAMTRAMERLIVSGSIGQPGDGSDETPIGWVLGPARARRRGTLGRAGTDRGRARSGDRPAPHRSRTAGASPRIDADGESADAGGRERSARAVRGVGGGPAATCAPAAGAHGRARAASSSRQAPVVQRPVAVRALLLPLLRRAGRRNAARRLGADGEGRGGLHPTETGDAVHRLLEQVDSATPPTRGSRRALVRGWYPVVSAAELATSRSSCGRTASRRSPGGFARCPASAWSARSSSRSRGCC